MALNDKRRHNLAKVFLLSSSVLFNFSGSLTFPPPELYTRPRVRRRHVPLLPSGRRDALRFGPRPPWLDLARDARNVRWCSPQIGAPWSLHIRPRLPPDHAIHPSRVKQKRAMVPTPLADQPLAHPIIRRVWRPTATLLSRRDDLALNPPGILRNIFLGPAFTDDIDGSVLRLFINAAYISPITPSAVSWTPPSKRMATMMEG